MVVWIVGAALAGLSGILLGMTRASTTSSASRSCSWCSPPSPSAVSAPSGAPSLGAFVVGILVEVSTLFIPPELKYVGALVVLILVLLVRPQGMLGKAQRVG